MENKTFCLRWNQHQEHLLGTLTQLLAKKELIDVTVRCNKKEQSRCFDAHKVKIQMQISLMKRFKNLKNHSIGFGHFVT